LEPVARSRKFSPTEYRSLAGSITIEAVIGDENTKSAQIIAKAVEDINTSRTKLEGDLATLRKGTETAINDTFAHQQKGLSSEIDQFKETANDALTEVKSYFAHKQTESLPRHKNRFGRMTKNWNG
jgi:gas vesicle protein